MGRALAALLLLWPLVGLGAVPGEVSGRIRLFASARDVPHHDLLRPLTGTRSVDADAGLRLEWKPRREAWEGEVALELTGRRGDSVEYSGLGFGAEDLRLMGLGPNLAKGDRQRLDADFDRLWVGTRIGDWRLALGRQALSLGNGIVFQPMDLFSPFSPTEIDRDYKRGEDMVLLQRPLASGGEVSILGVARRGSDDDYGSRASSAGARYSGFAGSVAFDVMAGEHLDGALLAFGASGPVADAVWRADLVLQDADEDGWTATSLVNLDWSFVLGGRNVYVFGEYFYNGFGVDDLPPSAAQLPADLLQRVGRGELFTLGRHYTAVGGTLEWHALWTQQLLLISSLEGASNLLQTTLNWDPADHTTVQVSLIAPLGDAGDEFGGVPLAPDPTGGLVTTGGGLRIQLRYARYF